MAKKLPEIHPLYVADGAIRLPHAPRYAYLPKQDCIIHIPSSAALTSRLDSKGRRFSRVRLRSRVVHIFHDDPTAEIFDIRPRGPRPLPRGATPLAFAPDYCLRGKRLYSLRTGRYLRSTKVNGRTGWRVPFADGRLRRVWLDEIEELNRHHAAAADPQTRLGELVANSMPVPGFPGYRVTYWGVFLSEPNRTSRSRLSGEYYEVKAKRSKGYQTWVRLRSPEGKLRWVHVNNTTQAVWGEDARPPKSPWVEARKRAEQGDFVYDSLNP